MPVLKPNKKRCGPATICSNGQLQKRTNIAISDAYKRTAKKIGEGNISSGIRKALDYYQDNHNKC